MSYVAVGRYPPGVLARILAVDLFVTLGMEMSFFLLPVYAVNLGLNPASFLFLFGGSHLLAAPLSLGGGALADRVPRKLLYVGNYAVEAVMLAVLAFAGARCSSAWESRCSSSRRGSSRPSWRPSSTS